MNIDWSQLVTKEMKTEAQAAQLLASVVAENSRLRAIADEAITPLQDAVDVDEATDAEVAMLKAWKKYRVALNRLADEPCYPTNVVWPIAPS